MQNSKQSITEKYNLDAKDQLLIRQLTEYPSTPQKDLASLVGMSVTAVKKRLGKPSFKRAISEVTQSTDAALNALAHTAIQRIRRLMESNEERIVLEACKLALNHHANQTKDRSGAIYQEVIYKTRFGEQGELISETEKIPRQGPKNTLELLAHT